MEARRLDEKIAMNLNLLVQVNHVLIMSKIVIFSNKLKLIFSTNNSSPEKCLKDIFQEEKNTYTRRMV